MSHPRNARFEIPPRWLNCPRKSTDLIAQKFLAFKTPLSPSFDVPPANKFTPSMLLSSIRSYKVKLGLWIDLTNTDRFYDQSELQGIAYLKLRCQGHDECPTADQTSTFIRTCRNFIAKHPKKIIGVHCTHGFNRTGFLIASFLIENENYSVEAAVAAFAHARSPGIYKLDYLLELYSRYGGEVPVVPNLPDWCKEFDGGRRDSGNENKIRNGNGKRDVGKRNDNRNGNGRRGNKEPNPSFMEGVPGVVPVTDPQKLSQIQKKVQEMCGWTKQGFPGLQPISMDKTNLDKLHFKPYHVSWKADGTRYMMLIDGKGEVYFVDRDNSVFNVQNLTFPNRKEPAKHLSNTLLDGEMVIDKDNGLDVPRYLVYDIVKYEGLDVGKTDFSVRCQCIGKEIVGSRNAAIGRGEIKKESEPFSVRQKQFWDLSGTSKLLSEDFAKQCGHDTDGLVFQPVVEPYASGRNMEVLKWKLPKLNSVDFRLIVRQENREGFLSGVKGQLYVCRSKVPFAEIKVTKELRLFDKKIIECRWEDGQWEFMRERKDKSFPNSIDTANAVCQSIADPVTKEHLLGYIERYRWQPPTRKRQYPEETDGPTAAKRTRH